MGKNKVLAIGVLVLVGLLITFSVCFFALKSRTDTDPKNITVRVIDFAAEVHSLDITTSQQYLGDALREENILPPKNAGSPTFVYSVMGITADPSKQEWWSVSKNGEFLSTGVDDTTLSDKDSFSFTFKTGYSF